MKKTVRLYSPTRNDVNDFIFIDKYSQVYDFRCFQKAIDFFFTQKNAKAC